MKTVTPELTKLPIMEQFYTLQGEGYFQGEAAYFIRLGGCDVGCHWCDVKESWDASQWPPLEIDSLVTEASKHPASIVVITGGEPLMYPLDGLTKALHEAGKRTHIETSGAHPLSGEWDWITLSPKKFKAATQSVIDHADELKVVIFNKSDFEFAEEYAARIPNDCLLYLQPEWSKRDEMLPLMVEYVKQNPRWRIGLQNHKYINIP
jgi:7-carboxy-7-deazaguanine synthase